MSMFDGRGERCTSWAAIGLVLSSMLPLGGCAGVRQTRKEEGLDVVGIQRELKQQSGGPDEEGRAQVSRDLGAIDEQVADLVSTPLPKRPAQAPVSVDMSTGFRNRYVASGFVVGDGPVNQSSLGLTFNEGPLPGARLFLWGDTQLTNQNAAGEAGVDEIDVGLSVPLANWSLGDGTLAVSADTQAWVLRGAPDMASVGVSATYSDPSGFSFGVNGRHLFEHSSIPSGDFMSLQLGQSVPLNESGRHSLDFTAEYGRAFHFFGASHQYLAPKLGLNLGLWDNATLRLEAGYQFGIEGESAPNQPIFGAGLNVRF